MLEIFPAYFAFPVFKLRLKLASRDIKRAGKALLICMETNLAGSDANKAKSHITIMPPFCLPQDRDLNRCYLCRHLSTCPNKKPPGYWRQVKWNARVGAVTDDHTA